MCLHYDVMLTNVDEAERQPIAAGRGDRPRDGDGIQFAGDPRRGKDVGRANKRKNGVV